MSEIGELTRQVICERLAAACGFGAGRWWPGVIDFLELEKEIQAKPCSRKVFAPHASLDDLRLVEEVIAERGLYGHYIDGRRNVIAASDVSAVLIALDRQPASVCAPIALEVLES